MVRSSEYSQAGSPAMAAPSTDAKGNASESALGRPKSPMQPSLKCRNGDVTVENSTASSTGQSVALACVDSDACVDAPETVSCRDYVVRPMPARYSPGARCVLQSALDDLSKMLRDSPTLPVDPCDASKPLDETRLQGCGLQLPTKHCAFSVCSWAVSVDEDLVQHLDRTHTQDLDKIAKGLFQWRGFGKKYYKSVCVFRVNGAQL